MISSRILLFRSTYTAMDIFQPNLNTCPMKAKDVCLQVVYLIVNTLH